MVLNIGTVFHVLELGPTSLSTHKTHALKTTLNLAFSIIFPGKGIDQKLN